MNIVIVGSKGIPAKYGGYETFAEKISHQFELANNNVVVVGDESSSSVDLTENIKNYSIPVLKSKNPFEFWHKSVKYAVSLQPDAIIYCGVAGIFSYLYFYKYRHISFMNPDGLGFLRSKYGFFKKALLFIQYVLCAIMVRNIICDSYGIKKYFEDRMFRKKGLYVAEYGAEKNVLNSKKSELYKQFIAETGLRHYTKFFLVIARLEPENNVKMILDAYLLSNNDAELWIVGGLNTQHYLKDLKPYAKYDGIRFLGGIYEEELLQVIRLKAHLFIHGHSVGGTNPSLIEAMASSNLIAAHFNQFNKAVLGTNAVYFSHSKELEMIFRSDYLLNLDVDSMKKGVFKSWERDFTWPAIAQKYTQIIAQV